MWVVQLEEEKWRRPFKIFFPAFRWKMTHDFHFSKPSSWEKNQEKWHLIPFSEDVAILLIFPRRKIDNTHTFLAPIFKNSIWSPWKGQCLKMKLFSTRSVLCKCNLTFLGAEIKCVFLQANSAILTYGHQRPCFLVDVLDPSSSCCLPS